MTELQRELPRDGCVRAVAVLLHGLNLHPDRMDGWSAMLRQLGAEVLRFPLHGHSGEVVDMKTVTADRWRMEFQSATEVARSEADRLGVPLHFVGYSLGALVALDWMSRQPVGSATFDALVLAAPALSAPRYSRAAVKLLSVLGDDFILPARSPRRYRAIRGTSMAAYHAFFALKDALERTGYRNADRPTLVLIDRRDELIDSRVIARTIRRHRLEHWTLSTVENDEARRAFGFRHLMVDEEAMGRERWAEIKDHVARHLRLSSGPRS